MDYLKEVWRAALPWASHAGSYLWASAKALIKTTAVWGAVATLFLGTYWTAYLHGAAGKRALRDEVASAERARRAANDRSDMLATGNREALLEIKRLKGQIEAMMAEAAKAASEPKSAPVAAVSKKQVTKAVRTKTPVSEAPASWLPPWGR